MKRRNFCRTALLLLPAAWFQGCSRKEDYPEVEIRVEGMT